MIGIVLTTYECEMQTPWALLPNNVKATSLSDYTRVVEGGVARYVRKPGKKPSGGSGGRFNEALHPRAAGGRFGDKPKPGKPAAEAVKPAAKPSRPAANAADTGGIPAHVRTALQAAEAKFKFGAGVNEQSVDVDASGKPLLERNGTTDTIEYTDADMKKLRGAHSTHSHPSTGGSFSGADVGFAFSTGLASQRAVDKNWVYEMRPASGKTFEWTEESRAKYGPVWNVSGAHDKVMQKQISKLLARRTELDDEAFMQEKAEITHRINVSMAKKFGYVYMRTKRGAA